MTHPEAEAVEAGWPSILLDAFTLVHGDRGESYGPPWEDYFRTAEIFGATTGVDLSVPQALLFMHSVKMSRIAHGLEEGFPPEMLRDSITDAAGYLDCLWGALNMLEATEDEDEYEDEETEEV